MLNHTFFSAAIEECNNPLGRCDPQHKPCSSAKEGQLHQESHRRGKRTRFPQEEGSKWQAARQESSSEEGRETTG